MCVIALFPFPEIGHINPMLKLGKMLARAGHDISFIGFAEHESYYSLQGVAFVPILDNSHNDDRTSDARTPKQFNSVSKALGSMEEGARASSLAFTEVKQEVERIAKALGPDLIIVDYLIGGVAYHAVRTLGVRSALLASSYFEMPMLGDPGDDPERWELPVLVQCPKLFDYPNVHGTDNRIHIEASVDTDRRELYDFPWHRLDATKPLIYCSVGSQPHLHPHSGRLFSAAIEAMQVKREFQMVLAIGRDACCDSFGRVPENVILVNWAPQVELIKRAALVICHAGLGAIKECILFAVPMIVFPCRWDHPYNAARVVAHGLGIRGSIKVVSAQKLLKSIETLSTTPAYKRNIEAMSMIFREIEESEVGLRAVEKILSETTVSSRLTGSPRMQNASS
jgi:UDP:flavonoid glycosyltransferase YjiC (YdhE family)